MVRIGTKIILSTSGDFFVMANNDEADETTLFIIIACVLALVGKAGSP